MSFVCTPALSNPPPTSAIYEGTSEHCALFVYTPNTYMPISIPSAAPGIPLLMNYIGETATGEIGCLLFGREEDLKVVLNRLEMALKVHAAFIGKEAKYRIIHGDEINVDGPIPFVNREPAQ